MSPCAVKKLLLTKTILILEVAICPFIRNCQAHILVVHWPKFIHLYSFKVLMYQVNRDSALPYSRCDSANGTLAHVTSGKDARDAGL